MKLHTDFMYQEDPGWAICIMGYNGKVFEGGARCHPDDLDYASERTGCCIAEARAYMKVLRFKRDYEIKPQLKILQHLYANISASKNFNPISYENTMIRSQIRAIENQLTLVNNELAEERKSLKEYIENKDKLYQRLRAKSKQ